MRLPDAAIREPKVASYSYSVSHTGNRHDIPTVGQQESRFRTSRYEPARIDTTVASETSSDALKHDVYISDAPVSHVSIPEDPTSDVHLPEVPASDAHLPEVPASDAHLLEVPASDVHLPEVPTSDVHLSEGPTSDVHLSEDPASDVHAIEVPPVDIHLSKIPVSGIHFFKVPASGDNYISISDLSAFEALIPNIPDANPTNLDESAPETPSTEAPVSELSYDQYYDEQDDFDLQDPDPAALDSSRGEAESIQAENLVQKTTTPASENHSPTQYRLAQYSFRAVIGG